MKKTYEFENLGCAHCAGKMEEKIGKLPDVESVNLSFPMKKMYVETSREDLLPEIQKICTDIEPDVIVTEVTKKSSKRKKHVEEDSHESHEHHHHHDEHCDCGCDHNHNEHEHLEHHHHHDEHCDCGCEHDHEEHEHHKHHHHHDEHCDCGCCDDDDDDDESIAAAANREGNGQATVFIVEKLGCAHCAGKMEEQISHLPLCYLNFHSENILFPFALEKSLNFFSINRCWRNDQYTSRNCCRFHIFCLFSMLLSDFFLHCIFHRSK